MNEPASRPELSVRVNEAKCTGCVVCLRACPTQAVRLRNGRAVILPEACVECGECIRACPQRAVGPAVSTIQDTAQYKINVLIVSRVLYTQFGEEVSPNEILVALCKMGFDHVVDGALYCEWVQLALGEWLRNNPQVRTALSPTCPVVMNLIVKRFPELIPNVAPILSPRRVAARHIRRTLTRRLGLPPSDIGVFHLTPCAAKTVAFRRPSYGESPEINGSLGMQDLFGPIYQKLKTLTDEDRDLMSFRAGGAGLGYELSADGVSRALMAERTLSVTGLGETLEVLEQVSSGLLADFRYIECNTCPDGCLGGPLTVDNRFTARATLRRLVQMYGTMPRVRFRDIEPLIREGFFKTDRVMTPSQMVLDENPLKAMKKMKKINDLTARLPGRLCGVCGAPDCRTLAEDVVMGRADLAQCPFHTLDEKEKGQ
jgi:iron only hydrogenase large subunit-like protein